MFKIHRYVHVYVQGNPLLSIVTAAAENLPIYQAVCIESIKK